MKRIIPICLFVLLALPTWSLAAAIGPARVSYLNGEILFRSPDAEEWLPATVNTPLDEGDALWCPEESRVEIQLPDGSIVRLDGGSQLDLLANEDDFMHLHLASGHLYLRTSQITQENALQIDSDDTTVLPAGRTRLRIDMLPNSLEDVAIIKGSAYVEGNGSRTRVRAGEQIMLEEGHNEILTLAPADSWELWNLDRDLAQSRSNKTVSYLPEELRSHTAELDANGRWVNVPEYGMVWRPTVLFSGEWAPYRSGRWIWKDDDYVWLSAEEWGWVPYHYGRWTVVSGLGWCWVPPVRGDVYWGPGYVGWYRTGSQVGWTPLAPGEPFYGRGNYGPRNINITNVTTINKTTIIYKNRSQRGGLTVLPQNDFLRGRSAVQQSSRNSSLSVSVSLGSPRIQPLRETRMPIVRQTPPRVAPPRIEHRDSRELRERFPRVAPAPAVDRRRQQTTPATSVPAPPAGRTPQVREKQFTHPVAPGERPAPQEQHQPQTAAPQRDERRQGTRSPQAPPHPGQATAPLAQPQQPVRQQRDERRQEAAPARGVAQPSQPATAPVQPQQPVRQQRDEHRQGLTPPPAVSQPVQPTAPLVQPQQPVRQQRDERRQETTPQRANTQPAPPVTQSPPPISGSAPQRSEQPRRSATTPADNQMRPAATRPDPPAALPKPAVQPATPQQAGQPQRQAAPKDVQPRKVWKVTTPEKANEKDPQGKEPRGNEHRER